MSLALLLLLWFLSCYFIDIQLNLDVAKIEAKVGDVYIIEDKDDIPAI